MIKVNLLRDQTVRQRKAVAAVKPEVSRTGLLVLAVFGLLMLGLGSYWYYLSDQITKLTEKREKLKIENERLKGLKLEIDKFEKLKKVRQARIDVIEKLKESQTGPVLLLNRASGHFSSVDLELLEEEKDAARFSLICMSKRKPGAE